jgi:transposase
MEQRLRQMLIQDKARAQMLSKKRLTILKESIETDEHEDEIYGDSTPYNIPKELVDKKYRLKKIRLLRKRWMKKK